MRLVLSTRNEHKLREFRVLLEPHELVPLPDDVELPPETGETFEENARVKADAAAAATGMPAVADDSGIEAAALGGRPGVRSARYAGEGASDEENLEKLLREVAAAGDERRAYYTCALALIEEGGSEHVFEARWDGHLVEEPRGEGGFGYDPAFVSEGQEDGRTASELSDAEKNEVSHRGRAARMLAAHLAERGATPSGR